MSLTSAERRTETAPRTSSWVLLADATFAYVGATMVVTGWAQVPRAPLSPAFLAACGLGLYGWITKPTAPAGRPLWYARGLAVWFVVSSIAAWDQTAAYLGVANAVWLVLIIPGAASLMGLERFRRSFLMGALVGAGYYMMHFVVRLLGPAGLTDGPDTSDFLGENRNAVSVRLVFVAVAVFAAARSRFFRLVRWPMALTILLWVMTIGGRSALLGLAAMALAQFALSPGRARRVRLVASGSLAVLALVSAAAIVGAPYTQTLDKVQDTLYEPRSAADEAREVLTEKAIDTMLSNPLFGVGIDNFARADFDTRGASSTRHVADIASGESAHNLYLQLGATLGIVGGLLFIALQASAFVGGIRRRSSPAARIATVGLVGVVAVTAFHSLLGPALYLPIVFLLGATCVRPSSTADHRSGDESRSG